MVVNIQADTQNIIQNAVARSFSNALTPRDVASSIRNSIGLFPGQQTALMNYRQGLKESGMKPDRVDAFSSKYEDRLLDYRAKMIARTETRQATNQGQLFIWQDAQNQDLIAPTAKKVWVVDGAPCEICEPMDGVAIGLAESWTLPNGDIADIPTDAHPHCFCGMELEFGTEDRPQAEEYNHGYEDQE